MIRIVTTNIWANESLSMVVLQNRLGNIFRHVRISTAVGSDIKSGAVIRILR